MKESEYLENFLKKHYNAVFHPAKITPEISSLYKEYREHITKTFTKKELQEIVRDAEANLGGCHSCPLTDLYKNGKTTRVPYTISMCSSISNIGITFGGCTRKEEMGIDLIKLYILNFDKNNWSMEVE